MSKINRKFKVGDKTITKDVTGKTPQPAKPAPAQTKGDK